MLFMFESNAQYKKRFSRSRKPDKYLLVSSYRTDWDFPYCEEVAPLCSASVRVGLKAAKTVKRSTTL